MRLLRLRIAAALFAATLVPCLAHAAGYNIYEQGAAALGMAGAVTASVADPSANYFNPARLTRLEGTQAQVGGTWLTTRNSFAGVDPFPQNGTVEEMKSGNFFPPTLYLTHRVSDAFAAGFGVNAPYGLGVEWQNPATFTGREIVTKANLQTLDANLNLAYRLNSQWSLAAGANLVLAKVELNRKRTQVLPGGGGATANVADVKLESGYKSGIGWNGAIAFVPNPRWSFGAWVRTQVDIDAEGDATFTQTPTGNAPFDSVVRVNLPPSQSVTASIVLPSIVSFGAAWSPTPAWTYGLTANFTSWSAFETLPLDFQTTNSLDTEIIEKYEDTFQIRVGAEHRLPSWTYRLGYYFDEAAAPTESVSPLLPDSNRHGVTLGFGKAFGHWTLDAYNLALFVENRSTENKNRDGFDGLYKAYVNATGATLTYRW